MNQNHQTIGQRVFYIARRSALLRRMVAMPGVAGVVDRICRTILRPAPGYSQWIARRVKDRSDEYACDGEPGLLSFLTTVWDTPLEFLQPAVESLLKLQTVREFQWVVLDNGSGKPEVIDYLKEIVPADPRVVYLRVEKNLGIIGGMRLALSKATGRYVLPFDSDDLLYPDAVAILTNQLRANDYPPAMYSDEDKLEENRRCWPSLKPDWDPVLFLNSCYVAHLGCFNRKLAMELGVYTDPRCEGCHDWDSFLRFHLAGHVPVHMPEVVYSWRMHAGSTAGNIRSKNFIYESQRNLLEWYLIRAGLDSRFVPRLSPLFRGTPDWHLQRKPGGEMPVLTVTLTEKNAPATDPALRSTSEPAWVFNADSDARLALARIQTVNGLMLITFDTLKLSDPDWQLEVTGIIERHPDTVVIGGRALNSKGRVMDAGRVPAFGGLFGCPDRGRDAADPGHLAQMWKQRSVSGVSTRLCVMRMEFLRQVLETFPNHFISWRFLGAWVALAAWRQKQRIIYTPFLTGICDDDPDAGVSDRELQAWKQEAGDFMSDCRYYHRHLSLAEAYQPCTLKKRGATSSPT